MISLIQMAQWAGALWLIGGAAKAGQAGGGVDPNSPFHQRGSRIRDRLKRRKLFNNRPGTTVLTGDELTLVDEGTPAAPTVPTSCTPTITTATRPARIRERKTPRMADNLGAWPWDSITTAAAALQATWNKKLREYREARAQYETDRETARGLLRLADSVDAAAKRAGKSPGERAPLRIARIRVAAILAGDQGRLDQLARVEQLIGRAITRGAPDGLGVLPLIPIAAIGLAIAAIVVALSWLRTHSKTIELESRKLAALANGLLTTDQLKALAESGAPLSLGGTIREFGTVALIGAAVLAGALVYRQRRRA